MSKIAFLVGMPTVCLKIARAIVSSPFKARGRPVLLFNFSYNCFEKNLTFDRILECS